MKKHVPTKMGSSFCDPLVLRTASHCASGSTRDMLAWSSDVVRSDLRLLELDEDLLEEISECGVVIKGAPTEEAVLCSKSKTFSIKFVETSNLQMLLSPGMQEEVHTPDSQADEDPSQGVSATQALRSPAGLQTQVAHMSVARSRPPLLVGAVTKAHLELCEIRPRLHELHALLSERPYGLQEEEEEAEQGDMMDAEGHTGDTHMDVDSLPEHSHTPAAARGPQCGRPGPSRQTYTFQQLLARVQASEAQLHEELQALHALELDGSWRLVDPQYLGHLLQLVMASAEAEGWSLQRIPLQPVCEVLSGEGYRQELIRHCLDVYSTQGTDEHQETQPGGSRTDQHTTYCLDKAKVCRYLAQQVLSSDAGPAHQVAGTAPTTTTTSSAHLVPGRAMSWRHFLAAWHKQVPACLHPCDADLLRGEVLLEGKGPDAAVRLFQASRLPTDPRARFHILFTVRSQWEESELEPYLMGLKEPGFTGGALLLKYARASQPVKDGPVFYTAR